MCCSIVLRWATLFFLTALTAAPAIGAAVLKVQPIPSSTTVSQPSRLASLSLEQYLNSPQLGAAMPEGHLMARVDGAQGLLSLRSGSPAPILMGDAPAFTNGAAGEVPGTVRYGLGLSKPDRWTSVITTLALCVFFFLRRMV